MNLLLLSHTKEYLKNSISLKLQSVFANEFCILQKLNLHIWKKIKCLYWYICVCAAYILPYDSPELIGFVWLALLSRLAGNYVFVCIFYYLLKLHHWAQAQSTYLYRGEQGKFADDLAPTLLLFAWQLSRE